MQKYVAVCECVCVLFLFYFLQKLLGANKPEPELRKNTLCHTLVRHCSWRFEWIRVERSRLRFLRLCHACWRNTKLANLNLGTHTLSFVLLKMLALCLKQTAVILKSTFKIWRLIDIDLSLVDAGFTNKVDAIFLRGSQQLNDCSRLFDVILSWRKSIMEIMLPCAQQTSTFWWQNFQITLHPFDDSNGASNDSNFPVRPEMTSGINRKTNKPLPVRARYQKQKQQTPTCKLQITQPVILRFISRLLCVREAWKEQKKMEIWQSRVLGYFLLFLLTGSCTRTNYRT